MKPSSEFSPNFRIPVGTQVVLKRDQEARRGSDVVTKKAGSVAEIVDQPITNEYPYSIRFVDGSTTRARQHDLTIRRSLAPEEDGPDREIAAYEQHLILRVAMGSRAYGLSTADSDTDEKGVYLPPADWHWSIHPLPEQIEFKRTNAGTIVRDQTPVDGDDFCWWEVEKFLRLAIKANPTALEVLFVPSEFLLSTTRVGEELLGIRSAFLSKFIYQTYSGYALSQFRRMKRALDSGKPHKPKHAMHLVRLLLSGITALKDGEVQVDMTSHREELLAMKSADYPFSEVYKRALQLDAEFQQAFVVTNLPDKPDIETVDAFLVRARGSAV